MKNKKDLVPYKKGILKKILLFFKNKFKKTKQEPEILINIQNDSKTDFIENLKFKDNNEEVKNILLQIKANNNELYSKNEDELYEIEEKLLNYLNKLENNLIEEKKLIKKYTEEIKKLNN